ncbi:MAG: molybdopterin biosynthesis protein [Candidatus Pelagibacter sp. TMED275]|nr:MAG: molybdopterin biosynthesis protein [Candidatus Pelagibacter sp. TMED275]|tara:strand:- start:801 stop:1547 length:747 start_codon:yes stop_codon:yes gene_type:complete
MKSLLSENQIVRFEKQILLKEIGVIGQKKLLKSKILIIGVGGLGCPIVDILSRAGVGEIGIVDNDVVSLSNIHRQTLFDNNDLGKSKVSVVKNKVKKINSEIKVKIFKKKINFNNVNLIGKNFDYIIDGSDNFKTKLLLNDYCRNKKKKFISGAVSKFDGHVFSFNFKKKNSPCLRDFFQNIEIDGDFFNCEEDGVVGTLSSIIGNIQANEVLKRILDIGTCLENEVLIVNILNLNLRKVKIKSLKNS